MPAGDRKVTVMFERQGRDAAAGHLVAKRAERGRLYEGQADKLTEGRYHAWVVDPALAGDPSADFRGAPSGRRN